MSESETYVTKKHPSIDDWLAYNEDYFARLKGEEPSGKPHYAPLVDVNRHAQEAGMSTQEYFEQLQNRVGSLGRGVLRLVYSDMDNASHVIIAPLEATA